MTSQPQECNDYVETRLMLTPSTDIGIGNSTVARKKQSSPGASPVKDVIISIHGAIKVNT